MCILMYFLYAFYPAVCRCPVRPVRRRCCQSWSAGLQCPSGLLHSTGVQLPARCRTSPTPPPTPLPTPPTWPPMPVATVPTVWPTAPPCQPFMPPPLWPPSSRSKMSQDGKGIPQGCRTCPPDVVTATAKDTDTNRDGDTCSQANRN